LPCRGWWDGSLTGVRFVDASDCTPIIELRPLLDDAARRGRKDMETSAGKPYPRGLGSIQELKVKLRVDIRGCRQTGLCAPRGEKRGRGAEEGPFAHCPFRVS
jgi:hypothetical protein